ncbi:Hypothetical predicted protein, partial [Paramuricea clavata]
KLAKRFKHLNKVNWSQERVAKVADVLNKGHQNSLPGLSKRVMIPREQGEPSSTQNQPTPHNCPDWAHVVENGQAQVADVDTKPPQEGTAVNDATTDLNVSENFITNELYLCTHFINL